MGTAGGKGAAGGRCAWCVCCEACRCGACIAFRATGLLGPATLIACRTPRALPHCSPAEGSRVWHRWRLRGGPRALPVPGQGPPANLCGLGRRLHSPPHGCPALPGKSDTPGLGLRGGAAAAHRAVPQTCRGAAAGAPAAALAASATAASCIFTMDSQPVSLFLSAASSSLSPRIQHLWERRVVPPGGLKSCSTCMPAKRACNRGVSDPTVGRQLCTDTCAP